MSLLMAASALTACNGNQENKQHYENKVFILGKVFMHDMRIDREENVTSMERELSVGIAKPEGLDIDIVFEADPQLLGTYRKAYYDPDALLLPSEYYDLSNAQAVIREGAVESNPVTIEFTKLDELDIDDNKHYVLPVSIRTKEIGILNGARTVYYVFKKADLINVVADINKNMCWPAGGPEVPASRITDDYYKGMHDWNNSEPFKDLETFTIEALVMLSSYKSTDIQAGIQTIIGIEQCFLLRVGDANLSNTQLQVAVAYTHPDSVDDEKLSNPNMKMKLGQWYHIAVTFDKGMCYVYMNGVEVGSQEFTVIKSVDFSAYRSDENNGQPRCLWVGHSYDIGGRDRYLDGRISEIRMWNRVLTLDEIRSENHFYRIAPLSEGLIGYWKFNDGGFNGATTAKDYSIYGNDMQFHHAPKWINVEIN